MQWGPLTVQRHADLRLKGIDLHVFVRGEDVTDRCTFADDVAQVAHLLRKNNQGLAHLDEDGEVAVEVVTSDVVIRPA